MSLDMRCGLYDNLTIFRFVDDIKTEKKPYQQLNYVIYPS